MVLLSHIKLRSMISQPTLSSDLSHESHVLGMQWLTEHDAFRFNIDIKFHPTTRDGILSVVSSLYDPLGSFLFCKANVFSKSCVVEVLDGLSLLQIKLVLTMGRLATRSAQIKGNKNSLMLISFRFWQQSQS